MPSSDEEGVKTCGFDGRRDNVPADLFRFAGSATGVLSLSRLRRQLPLAVALLLAASATSRHESFGFVRRAAETLHSRVFGAYHQVEPRVTERVLHQREPRVTGKR